MVDRYSERPARPAIRTEQREGVAAESGRVEVPRAYQDKPSKKLKFSKKTIIAFALALALLAVTVWWFIFRSTAPSFVNTGEYQMVYLANGEYYFGKVKTADENEVRMTNVFYVQKATAVDATSKDKQNTNNLELVKLGEEIHGPQDEMVITRSQVLYMENLKNDGKVKKVIDTYYEQNKK